MQFSLDTNAAVKSGGTEVTDFRTAFAEAAERAALDAGSRQTS